jgi:hypothetical protein
LDLLTAEVNRVIRLLKDPNLRFAEAGSDQSGGKVLRVVGQSRGAKYLHISFKISIENHNKITDFISQDFSEYLRILRTDLRLMRANMMTEVEEMRITERGTYELSFKSRVPHKNK